MSTESRALDFPSDGVVGDCKSPDVDVGTKLVSSLRVVLALNHGATSSVPILSL